MLNKSWIHHVDLKVMWLVMCHYFEVDIIFVAVGCERYIYLLMEQCMCLFFCLVFLFYVGQSVVHLWMFIVYTGTCWHCSNIKFVKIIVLYQWKDFWSFWFALWMAHLKCLLFPVCYWLCHHFASTIFIFHNFIKLFDRWV